jgi:hypothetical protein
MMRICLVSFGLVASGLMSPAVAQDIRVGDLRAHFYLETTGKLSEDVLTQKGLKLYNMPRGEGIFSEPVNTVVFNVQLLGAKNSQPKFASALVNITTTNRTGQKKLETRPLLGFVFGEDGKVNRPIVLDNVTCSKVEIEVKAKGASRRASLDFECNDPKAADAGEPARQAQNAPRR